MNVIEPGIAVRRLAPPPTPDSPPITLSEQGLPSKIVDEQTVGVEWSVSGNVLGQRQHIPEHMPLTLLLPLEYQIVFIKGGLSPARGVITRTHTGETDYDIRPLAGRFPRDLEDPCLKALTLVQRNAPGDLEAAVDALAEVCDTVKALPFHSAVRLAN
jgi:hypothetical protein